MLLILGRLPLKPWAAPQPLSTLLPGLDAVFGALALWVQKKEGGVNGV